MQKIVIANWKLNPKTFKEAKKIFAEAVAMIPRGVDVVICPPTLFLSELMRCAHPRALLFGVQNIFWEMNGAFTGELAPSMAQSVGATYAIVGHSERRALGETDEVVSKKVSAALKAGLKVIVCVGESVRDQQGSYLADLQGQIERSLANVPATLLSNLIVAYEPLWAIGKSAAEAVTPQELHEAVIFIRKVLHDQFGKKALSIPVIYGGAVAPENAESLVHGGEVAGLLVGHQSLKPEAFQKILQAVASVK